jgi:hypothetical protein
MRKRALLWAGTLLTTAVAGFLIIQLAWAPRATEENYQKLHDGMRRSDVESLLGPPTNDRVPAVSYLFLCSSSGTRHEEFAPFEMTDEALLWHDRGGTIIVNFRPGGIVTSSRYDPAQNESPLAFFRRLIRL